MMFYYNEFWCCLSLNNGTTTEIINFYTWTHDKSNVLIEKELKDLHESAKWVYL